MWEIPCEDEVFFLAACSLTKDAAVVQEIQWNLVIGTMTAESVVESNQSLAAEASNSVESNNIQKQQSGEVTTSGDELLPKVRKPYTITKQRERWTEEEHQKFLEALKLYGRAWRRIEEHIGTKTAVQIRSHAQKFFSKLEREQAGGISSGKAQDIGIPPPRPKRKPSHPYPRKAGVPAVENNVPSQTVLPSTPALLVSPTLCEGKMKPAAFAPYVSSRSRNVHLEMATMGTSPGGSQAELKLFGQTVVVPTVTRAVPPVVVKGIDKQAVVDPEGFELLKEPPSSQHNVEAEQASFAINTRIVSACSSGITMLESENDAADVSGCAMNTELKRAAYHENVVPPPILQFGNELRKLFATAPLNMPMTDQHPAMDLAAVYYSRFLEGLQCANATPPLNFCNLGLDGAWQPGSPNASIYAAAMAALWPNLSGASFSDMTSSVLRSMLTGISSDTFKAENSIDALAAASAWWTLQGFIRRGFLAQHMGPFLETAASLGMNSPLTMKRQDNIVRDHKRQDGQEGENMTMNECDTVEVPHTGDDSPLARLKHQTSKRTLTSNFEGLDGGKRRVRSRSISGCNDPCENDKNGPDSRPPSSSGSGDFSCENFQPRNGDGDASGNSGRSSNSSRCGAAQGTAIPTDGFSFDKDRTAEATTEQELNTVKILSLQHASSSNRSRPQHPRGQKAARPSRSGGSDGEQRKAVSQEGRMAFQALFANEKLPQTFSRGRPREFTHEDCATRAPHPIDEPVTSDLKSVCQFQIPLVSGRSSSFSIPVKGSLDEYTEQISGVESMASGTGPITGECSNSRDCGDGGKALAKVGSDASAFSVSSSSSSRSGFVPYCRAEVRVNPTRSKEFKPSCAMEADNRFRDGLKCLEEELKQS